MGFVVSLRLPYLKLLSSVLALERLTSMVTDLLEEQTARLWRLWSDEDRLPTYLGREQGTRDRAHAVAKVRLRV